MTDEQTLARSITSIVGADHVLQKPDLKIDCVRPNLLVRPGSADEVAECVKVCSEADAAVVPAGQMTWLDWGNPLKRGDVVLSLERMRRIVDYSPPDLTATVEAGLTLSEFNALTAGKRQWLPLDPPGFKGASLGAIAACNSSGALRLGFGSPRDYLIGLQLVHADGTKSKSGGKVVKNVAGYDMNKLYAGSHGTLAILTELTFKLRPLPDCSSTIVITSQLSGSLYQLARRIIGSELQPASVVLTRRVIESLRSEWREALLVRFNDSAVAVEHQISWVTQVIDDHHKATVVNDNEAGLIWADVADFDQHTIRVRLSVPLSAVSAEFEKSTYDHLDCVAATDAGTGTIRLAFDAEGESAVDQIKRLRAAAVGVNGTLTIEKAPTEVRRSVDAWGDAGSTTELMRSIKARFDPQSLLNPGKFVLGL
jgi:glycolate oxidase FAD binding subunit